MTGSANARRLRALETSFLVGEDVIPGYLGHNASLFVFEGPAPSVSELAARVESRLGSLPRYRQRVVNVPGGVARPVWVDDLRFDVNDHVLAASGELRGVVGELLARPVQRDRPLWELWLIDGLDDGRWAILHKLQEAAADGGSLVANLRTLFAGDEAAVSAGAVSPSGPARLAAGAAVDGLRAAAGGVRRAGAAALRPRTTVDRAKTAARGFGEMSAAAKRPVLESPLTGQSGPRRAIAFLTLDRAEMKGVAREHGTTVNDVFIAIAAGALRRWLTAHELSVDAAPLRAMVPVAVPDPDRDDESQLGMLSVPLPVHEPAVERRIDLTAETMRAAKSSSQGAAIASFLAMQDLLPLAALRAAGRGLWTARGLNVTITSVPGSMPPFSAAGRRALQGWAIGFLTPGLTLTFASMTYDGRFAISLIADPDAIADLEALAEHCAEEAAGMGLAPAEAGAATR